MIFAISCSAASSAAAAAAISALNTVNATGGSLDFSSFIEPELLPYILVVLQWGLPAFTVIITISLLWDMMKNKE